MSKTNLELLVATPTERTKLFCIERMLTATLAMDVPSESSLLLITTGKIDPIGDEVQRILRQHGPKKFSRAILKRLRMVGMHTIWDKEGFKPLTLQRNFALRVARQQGYKRLMFIDSDIEVPRDAYERLAEVDADVVGAFYESRYFEGQPFFGNRDREGNIIHPREGIDYKKGDILDIDYTGLGCSLLSRRVISEVVFPITAYKPEDIAFLELVKEKDMRIKAHTGVECKHHSLFERKIPQTEIHKFHSLTWLVYQTIGNYIIKDEVISLETVLKRPEEPGYTSDLPSFAIKANGNYHVIYTNKDDLAEGKLKAYVFIPRDLSRVEQGISLIYDGIKKLFL